MTALVLVHGGQHTSRCWEPTVQELARQVPGLPVLAVDLPGREAAPGDPDVSSIEASVTSVVEQVERAGLTDVVLVGHSMAGIVLPGVAGVLGADRVRRMVFVSCCVPPDGGTVVDTLSPVIRFIAGRNARAGVVSKPLPRPVARAMFCNGMTKQQRAFVLNEMCGEGGRVTTEPVHRSTMPDVPRSWVLLTRDRSLTPRRQRGFITNLGGVDDVVELDTCHDAMVSEPAALARILAERATPADA